MNQDRNEEYEDIMKNAINYPEELSSMKKRLDKKIRHKVAKRCLTSMGAFAGVLAIFTGLVNTSTVIAQAVNGIPVLGDFASYVKFDKGLQNSVLNGYIQEVNLKQESNGYTLKMPYVIADGKQLVMFFEMPEELVNPDGIDAYAISPEDSFLNEIGVWSVNSKEFMEEGNAIISTGLHMVTLRTQEKDIPRDLTVKVSLDKLYTGLVVPDEPVGFSNDTETHDSTAIATYEFKLHLNEYLEPRVMQMNQEIEVMGQPILFESVTEYATGTEIKAYISQGNDINITGLKFKGTDVNGKTWTSGEEARPSIFMGDNYIVMRYYLENNYFSNASLANLEITHAALYKAEEKKVTVDLLNKTMTPSPSDFYIQSITKWGEDARITFKTDMDGAQLLDRGLFSFCYWDTKGNVYQMDTQSHGEKENYITVHWPEDNQVILERASGIMTPLESPVKFPVFDSMQVPRNTQTMESAN